MKTGQQIRASMRGYTRMWYPSRMMGVPANINRRTGEPHQHLREIARRLAREVV